MIRRMILAGVVMLGALGHASAQYVYPAPGPGYIYSPGYGVEYRPVYRRPVFVAPPAYYAGPGPYYYRRPFHAHPGYYGNHHRLDRDRTIFHSR